MNILNSQTLCIFYQKALQFVFLVDILAYFLISLVTQGYFARHNHHNVKKINYFSNRAIKIIKIIDPSKLTD